MSYSLSTDEAPGSSIREAWDDALAKTMPRGEDGSVAIPTATGEHLAAAITAITDVLLPVLGQAAHDTYRVVVVGHANPDHAWAEGEDDEVIDIRVVVNHARPEVAPEESAVGAEPDGASVSSPDASSEPPEPDAEPPANPGEATWTDTNTLANG